MRALRVKAAQEYPGVRVNAIYPSFTEGRMTDGIKDLWIRVGVPTQKPDAIAKVMVGLAAASPGSHSFSHDEKEVPGVKVPPSTDTMAWDNVSGGGVTGRAIFVLGCESWDIEEGIDKTEPLWLGNEVSAMVKKAQACTGSESIWLFKSAT